MKAPVIIVATLFCFGFSKNLQAQNSPFDLIEIDSLINLTAQRGGDEVYLNDLIEFKIKRPDSVKLPPPQELFLYGNGYRLSPYQAKYTTGQSVVFQLFEADTLRGLLKKEINSWGIHETELRLSFGDASGNHVHMEESNARIDFDPNYAIRSWIGRAIILLVIIGFLSLSQKIHFLKDIYSGKYSLSRAQLGWWTMIVICCYIALWSDSGILVPLTSDTLILIGISATTAAAAQTIDISRMQSLGRNQTQSQAADAQKPAIHMGKNFFFQVLSDENGISIQRFQSVVFTFFIGVFFVFEVVTQFEMPDIDTGILGLMGISSATYAGLKTNEGKNRPLS